MNDSARCILVVEDEPLVRFDAVDLIEDAGFTVFDAGNAAEAVSLLEQHHIDVLFTDIDMPGEMDGLDLARSVRKRWPEVAIIIVSGHTKLARSDVPGYGQFFSKPYMRSAILKALGNASPH